MLSVLLSSHSFLPFEGDSIAFWVLLIAMVATIYISNISENIGMVLLMNYLGAAAVFLYTGLKGEIFWFLDIERVGLLIWIFGYIFTAILFGVIIGRAWGYIQWFPEIFRNFWFGIIGFVIGIIWANLLIDLISIMFREHPFILIITALGAVGELNAEMDKVPQAPQKQPNTDKPPKLEENIGFRSCRNCKWNQDRGSWETRCFLGRKGYKANDDCGQWNRA